MPEPTLSEINSFEADPERGTGTPAVVIDNSKSLELLNRNAMFHAENDMKKYNIFLDNVNNIMKDVNETSKMDVATQDRPALEAEKNAILSEIAKSPSDFFGPTAGIRREELQKRLSKFNSDSQESKLNRLFDYAHREFYTKNPSYQTEDNKSRLDGFWNKPLGERQLYTFDVPAMMDLNKLKAGILASPSVKRTNFEYGYSPDKKFISQDERTTYLREPFLQSWSAAYTNAHDENGKIARQFAKQQFDQLPKDLQEKFGNPENFWNEGLGKQFFGSDKDIEMTNKGKLTNNPYAVEQQKAADALRLEGAKHGNRLEEIYARAQGQKELASYKHELNGMEKAQKMTALRHEVEVIKNKAISDGNAIYDPNDKHLKGYIMPISGKTLENFAIKDKQTPAGKIIAKPKYAVLSPDGKTVSMHFYKMGIGKDADVPEKDANGNLKEDNEKTKYFTIEEFTSRYGKDVYGVNILPYELEGQKGADKHVESSTEAAKEKTKEPVTKETTTKKKTIANF